MIEIKRKKRPVRRAVGRAVALGVSIAVVALVTPQTAAFAAAKAGGSCKVVGQSSGTLVCATKGKKNVWAVGKAPIKLMTLTSETGPMMFPEIAASAKAAAKAINAAGGVSGRMIEIITCDDKLTPEAGADCARKAISEKVTAVVGASTGVSGDAYMPILEKAGIPSVANIPNSTAETTSPLSYPISSSALLIVAGGSVLKAAGSTKVQYLGPNIPAFVGLMQLVEALLGGAGVKFNGTTFYPVTATDYTQFAASAYGSGADGVMPLWPPPGPSRRSSTQSSAAATASPRRRRCSQEHSSTRWPSTMCSRTR